MTPAYQEQTLTVGKLEWFYREARPESTDKPPVLLLHGIPAHSFMWLEMLTPLAENGRRAIAPDWPGFGSSSKPDRRDFAYTPQGFLDALEGFIEALEIDRFSLIVQGFVGSVGIQYAFKESEKIERLIILNTPVSAEARLPQTMRQWGFPFIGDMLTQDPLLVDRTLEKGSGYVIADENLAVYRQPFLKNSQAGRALVATVKNMQLSAAMAELERGWRDWKGSTLFIWGMEDPWLNSAAVERLASVPNRELVKLPEGKHYPQEHFTKEIGEQAINFLRRQT